MIPEFDNPKNPEKLFEDIECNFSIEEDRERKLLEKEKELKQEAKILQKKLF